MARALHAGAAGYLGKHAEPEHLIAAVVAASAGALWIGRGVERPSFASRSVANDVRAILLKLAASDRADAARIIRAHLAP